YLAQLGQGSVEVAPDDKSYGERNKDGVPNAIGDFVLLGPAQAIKYTTSLNNLIIPVTAATQVQITKLGLGSLHVAKLLSPIYKYDSAADIMTNQDTGKIYRNEGGYFVLHEGETVDRLRPGFVSLIGLGNLTRVVTDPEVSQPFIDAFAWTV